MSNERLRAALLQRGNSTTALAEKLAVDHKIVGRWVSGPIPYRGTELRLLSGSESTRCNRGQVLGPGYRCLRLRRSSVIRTRTRVAERPRRSSGGSETVQDRGFDLTEPVRVSRLCG
jgi:hypothetical protein